MKTKIVVALLASTLWCISAFAQLNPAPSSTGSITVNAANCNTTNACIILHMASSNVGYSVTVSGTWTGTLTVEQSGDNQGSWTSATTTTANTLFTSALLPGITDARVRGSAAMTGTAVVTITASGPAILQQITQTGGGSSSASTLSGVIDVTNTAYAGGVKANGQAVGDASFTVGSPSTVTSASSTFTTADNGKICFGTSANLAGGDGTFLAADTTLTQGTFTFVSAHVGTCSGTGTALSTQTFVWGSDDSAGLAAAWNAAANTGTFCKSLILANGLMLTQQGQFNSFTCNSLGTGSPRFGAAIQGWGPAGSIIVPTPNFNFATCTGGASNVCFGGISGVTLQNFGVAGYGQGMNGGNHANFAMSVGIDAQMMYVQITGWGALDTSFVGLSVTAQQVAYIKVDGAGQVCIQAGTNYIQFTGNFGGSCRNAALVVLSGGYVVDTTGGYNAPSAANKATIQVQNGGTYVGYSTLFVVGSNNNAAIEVQTGGVAYAYAWKFPAGTNTCMAISGGKLYMENSTIGSGASQCITVTSGGAVFETGPNNVAATAGQNIVNFAGNFPTSTYQPWKSVRGSCTGVGTAASTLALRITGTSTTGTGIPTTCTSTTLDAGIAMDNPLPNANSQNIKLLMVTATAAGTNASSGVVTVLKNGVATAITCTIGTATACVDQTHTATFVAGDLISIQFTTQAADTLAGVKATVSAY